MAVGFPHLHSSLQSVLTVMLIHFVKLSVLVISVDKHISNDGEVPGVDPGLVGAVMIPDPLYQLQDFRHLDSISILTQSMKVERFSVILAGAQKSFSGMSSLAEDQSHGATQSV